MHHKKLEKNLLKLQEIETQSGVKILHTLKSFNESSVLPFIGQKLSGMSIGSQKELLMAKEANAKHLHLYAPAYKKDLLEEVADDISTLSFNSLSQWKTFYTLETTASLGLRINPKLNLPIPDYCNPNVSYSRLGVDGLEFVDYFEKNTLEFDKLEGLHFHALFQSSEQGVMILLDYILAHYKNILPQLKWLNLGGGHRFTDERYDVNTFVKYIKDFQKLYPHIQLYCEPGESVIYACGEFITTVLDIVSIWGVNVVILDTSIETHLLDVAIVNQRLKVIGTQAESTPYFYELSGNSCLQGDLIGEYFFQHELNIGDQVVFENMMGYSMVKMTEFNGMQKAEFLYH